MPQGVALYIGAVIGAGVLLLPGLSAIQAGPAALISWIFDCVLGIPLALTFAARAPAQSRCRGGADLRDAGVRVGEALEPARFSPRRAAGHLLTAFQALPAAADELRAAPTWPGAERDALLALNLELLATLAVVAAPIMPTFSSEVAKTLGLSTVDSLRPTLAWPSPGERLVPAGRRVDVDPPALFQPVLM